MKLRYKIAYICILAAIFSFGITVIAPYIKEGTYGPNGFVPRGTACINSIISAKADGLHIVNSTLHSPDPGFSSGMYSTEEFSDYTSFRYRLKQLNATSIGYTSDDSFPELWFVYNTTYLVFPCYKYVDS